MKSNTSSKTVRVQAYSLKELSAMYSVSSKTFKTWLRPFRQEIGTRLGRFYYPKQTKVIFERLGIPEDYHPN